MTEINIRDHLKPLQLIDIQKCTTVGKTVEQMENAAIGARMVGEAAETITGWIEAGKKPRIVMDDYRNSDYLYNSLVEHFAGRISSQEYVQSASRGPVIVVGYFLDRWKESLFDRGENEAIFINSFGMAPPWVKDGYFRGFVNGDPRLILPIIRDTVTERISGKPATFERLFRSWQSCGGVGHQAAHGFETFKQMIQDPDCTVMSGMSGIMTMAQMGGLISYMIDQKWIRAIASTGALIGHGLVEGIDLKHYKYDPRYSDAEYGKQRLNRITDTIEPEENLTAAEMIIHKILRRIPSGKVLSPVEINQMIGKHLSRYYKSGASILRSAFRKDIPVFVPAFWDSELGNDVETECQRRLFQKLERVFVCPGIDNQLLIDIVTGAKNLGVFILGGGTPRNYLMNVAPLIDVINERLGENYYPRVRYMKGGRICPDPIFLGHLSGCTWSENMSWGKTDVVRGRFSEVKADATILLPFYVAALKEEMESR